MGILLRRLIDPIPEPPKAAQGFRHLLLGRPGDNRGRTSDLVGKIVVVTVVHAAIWMGNDIHFISLVLILCTCEKTPKHFKFDKKNH